MTYKKISEVLKEKGIQITPNGIHQFVKARSKRRRQIYSLPKPDCEIDENLSVSEKEITSKELKHEKIFEHESTKQVPAKRPVYRPGPPKRKIDVSLNHEREEDV